MKEQTTQQGNEEDSTKVEPILKPCRCGKSTTGFCDGSHKKEKENESV